MVQQLNLKSTALKQARPLPYRKNIRNQYLLVSLPERKKKKKRNLIKYVKKVFCIKLIKHAIKSTPKTTQSMANLAITISYSCWLEGKIADLDLLHTSAQLE